VGRVSRTPSWGRVQIWNARLAEEGFSPLPTYEGEPEDPINTPELEEVYPLLFTDEHSDPVRHHALVRDLPWLGERRPDPYVKIHPETASAHGLSPDDWVEVSSPCARMIAWVELFEGVRPTRLWASTAGGRAGRRRSGPDPGPVHRDGGVPRRNPLDPARSLHAARAPGLRGRLPVLRLRSRRGRHRRPGCRQVHGV